MGPWRMNESEFHYVDDASVALRKDGTVGVVWVDNQRQDVFFRSYDAQGRPERSEAVNVSRSPRIFSWLPRIVMASDDELFVLWQEIVFSGGSHGGEILFSRSNDAGATFSEPTNLSNTMAGAGKGRLTEKRWDNGSLDIQRAPDGVLYAAWTVYQGALSFTRSLDGGRSFEAPRQLSGSETEPARGPSLAAGADGAVHLAWTVGEEPAADIHLLSSRDRGESFAEPQLVAKTDGHSDAPKLALDSRGNLHIVWSEMPPPLPRQHQVRYLRKSAESGASTAPRTISGSADASFPHIAIDAADQVYVLWERAPEAEQRPDGLGFVLSEDGGETFSEPSLVPGTDDALDFNGNLQGQLTRKLAVHGTGQIAAVNSRFRMNDRSLVQLVLGQNRAN